MKLASPNRVIKHFYPNFSIQEMLGLSFNRLTAAQESSGYKSVSYVGNMSTYLFMILAALGAILALVLLFLLCSCKSKIKMYLEHKVEQVKKKSYSLNKQI